MIEQWHKYLLIAAIGLGGLFEVIKRLDLLPSTDLRDQKEEISRLKLEPYVRNSHESDSNIKSAQAEFKVKQAHLIKAAAAYRPLVIPPTAGQFDSNAPLAADKKVAQTKEEKDKADKAKLAAKKAKKKCVKPGDTTASNQGAEDTSVAKPESDDGEPCVDEPEVAQEEGIEQPPEDTATPDEEPTQNQSGAVAVSVPVSPSDSSGIDGLEKWKTSVVDQPNFKETVRLIELYQSRQINSTLFYAVVDLMLNSSNLEVRQFGVLAAGRTPSLESFQVLSDVIKSENIGTGLRQRAESELKFYQEVGFLSVIEQVLHSSDDVFATILATKQLDESARRYLTVKTPASGNLSAAQVTAQKRYTTYFKRFVTILQSLSSSKDSLAASQARQTLLNLQALLKV